MNAPKAVARVENAHSDSVWAAAWSGSERLVTGSLDGSVRIWNSRALEKPVCATPKERVGVNSLSATDDGTAVLAAYQDATVRIFQIDESTGMLGERESIQGGIQNHLLDAWCVTASPDNDTFVTGAQTGKLHVSSIASGEKLLSFELPSKSHVMGTSYSDDGSRIAAGCLNGDICVFDPHAQQMVHTVADAHSLPVRSVTFSSDGNLLYSASDDHYVTIFDARSAKVITSFSHIGMALCVDASPDGRHFTVGSSDHSVYLWDMGMRKREHVYNTHSDQVWCVKYDATDKAGKRLVSVGDDALLQLYE